MAKRCLLIVDDEPAVCESVRLMAEREGLHVVTTGSAEAFRDAYEAARPEIVMIDIVMPGCDGPALLRELAEAHEETRVIIITGHGIDCLADTIGLGHDLGFRDISGMQKPLANVEMRLALKPGQSGARHRAEADAAV